MFFFSSQNARIQFRFVDGSSTVGHFDADQTLSEARAFVAQKLKEMNESQSFSLHSSFPKREYTTSDMSTSLRALQLAPSASLLVIPVGLSESILSICFDCLLYLYIFSLDKIKNI